MAEAGVFPLAHLNFPQGPFFDPLTQDISLEWFMWLQSLQFLLVDFIDVQSLRDVFSDSGAASVSNVQQQVNALKVQLALIPNPTAIISSLAKKLDALSILIAMNSQFNPGTLQKRIDAIAVMGVFV